MPHSKEEKISIKQKLLLISFILFFINILFLNKLNMPYISGDEIGYIGIAKHIIGRDWNGIMKYLSYYSYGYSILLLPFVLIFKNPITLYRVLILLSSLFSSLLFIVTYKLGMKITKDNTKHKNFLVFISLFITAHSSFIVRANLVLPEALMNLIYLLICHKVIDYIKENKTHDLMIITLLTSYLFVLHQRNIGIAIAVGIVLLLMTLSKRIKIRELILFFATFIAILLLNEFIKKYLKGSLWQGSEIFNVNDFSGQMQKITNIFTKDGFISFINTLAGHIFYFITSTFGFGLLGIIFIFKQIKNQLFDKLDKEFELFYLSFILLSFLGILGISVIFMYAGISVGLYRLDPLVYGRYIEMTFIPIVLFGSIYWFYNCKRKNSIVYVIAVSVCILLLGLSLKVITKNYSEDVFSGINSVFLNFFFYNEKLHFLNVSVFSMIVFLLITIFWIKKEEKVVKVLLLIGSILSIFLGAYVVYETIIPIGNINFKNYKPTKDIINEFRLGNIDNVYYLGYKMNSNGAYIQYFLDDIPLQTFNSEKDFTIKQLKGSHYLLTEQLSKEIIKNYDFKTFVNGVFYLKSKENLDANNSFNIPAKEFVRRFGYNDMENDDLKLISGGLEYLLLSDQRMTMDKGNYKFKIKLALDGFLPEMQDISGKTIATVKMKSYDPGFKNYGEIDVNIDDLNNGELLVIFNVDVIEKSFDFNIEVDIKKGYSLEIKWVSIE